MKKPIKFILIIFVLISLLVGGYFGYKKYMEYLEEERIKNAIIKIEYINPLEIEFNKEIKLSDLIIRYAKKGWIINKHINETI